MTREQAKELLPIIQAWVDEKQLQFKSRNSDKWIDITQNNIDFFSSYLLNGNVRVKPEPREFWIRRCNSGMHDYNITTELDKSMCPQCKEIIHVKEVI